MFFNPWICSWIIFIPSITIFPFPNIFFSRIRTWWLLTRKKFPRNKSWLLPPRKNIHVLKSVVVDVHFWNFDLDLHSDFDVNNCVFDHLHHFLTSRKILNRRHQNRLNTDHRSWIKLESKKSETYFSSTTSLTSTLITRKHRKKFFWSWFSDFACFFCAHFGYFFCFVLRNQDLNLMNLNRNSKLNLILSQSF